MKVLRKKTLQYRAFGVLKRLLNNIAFDVIDAISSALSNQDLLHIALTCKPFHAVEAKIECLRKVRENPAQPILTPTVSNVADGFHTWTSDNLKQTNTVGKDWATPPLSAQTFANTMDLYPQ